MSDNVYVLHPGEITSQTDGDIHYITAPRLARLYGLDYKRCRIIYDLDTDSRRGYKDNPNHIHLWPRRDSNYSLNNQNKVID